MNNSLDLSWLHPKDRAIARALLADGFAKDLFHLDSDELLDALGEVEGWLVARLCYTGVVLCFPPKALEHSIPFQLEEPCFSKDFASGSDEEDWLDTIVNPWELPRIGLDRLLSLKGTIESSARTWELSCGKQLELPLAPAPLLQENAIGIWGGIK